tara:strand:+ start:352 stop:582 length:231 start_codon:yes stop_codon:yes gene_type:complete
MIRNGLSPLTTKKMENEIPLIEISQQLADAMTDCLLNQELLNTIPVECREVVIANWVNQLIEFNVIRTTEEKEISK